MRGDYRKTLARQYPVAAHQHRQIRMRQKTFTRPIRTTPPGKGNEIQFTDALNALCGTSGVWAYEFEGKRYDMGDKLGATKATVEFALRSPEFGDSFRAYLKDLSKTL